MWYYWYISQHRPLVQQWHSCCRHNQLLSAWIWGPPHRIGLIFGTVNQGKICGREIIGLREATVIVLWNRYYVPLNLPSNYLCSYSHITAEFPFSLGSNYCRSWKPVKILRRSGFGCGHSATALSHKQKGLSRHCYHSLKKHCKREGRKNVAAGGRGWSCCIVVSFELKHFFLEGRAKAHKTQEDE